jgi:hypothetical protein
LLAYPVDADTHQDQFPHEQGLTAVVCRPAARDVIFRTGNAGMNTSAPMQMDIERYAALPFPRSLPEFQRLSPNDAACAEYLEILRWADGFIRPYCGATGEPFRIATRPGVPTCRKCRRQTGLTVGHEAQPHAVVHVVLGRLPGRQPYPGMSAMQFQRQLGIARYETAFQILHKLRAGMVRPDRDRIGRRANEHVEYSGDWEHATSSNCMG